MNRLLQRNSVAVVLAAALLAWGGPLYAQTLPMLVTLYEGENCAGERIDISEPSYDLGPLSWSHRARAFRIRYGAIQLVTGPDNSGTRFPENDNPLAWYTRADNSCVSLPIALAGHVRGVVSFPATKSQRACAQAAVQVFGVNLGAINDNIRACLAVTGEVVRSKQP